MRGRGSVWHVTVLHVQACCCLRRRFGPQTRHDRIGFGASCFRWCFMFLWYASGFQRAALVNCNSMYYAATSMAIYNVYHMANIIYLTIKMNRDVAAEARARNRCPRFFQPLDCGRNLDWTKHSGSRRDQASVPLQVAVPFLLISSHTPTLISIPVAFCVPGLLFTSPIPKYTETR